MKILLPEAELFHADRQTNSHDEANEVFFRKFANATKN
jgi:hypothetical protein